VLEHFGNLLGTHWEEEKKTKISQPLHLPPETMNPQVFNPNIETYKDVQISWPTFIVSRRQK
jgi:hypothetical protein